MTIELAGPAGKLQLETDGSFVVTGRGQTILALKKVFIESLGVRFSVVGVDQTHTEGSSLQASFETDWNGQRITFEASAEADGFRLVWSALPAGTSVGLALSLLPGGPWYGMGERLIQSWPLSKMNASSDPFGPVDTGRDGTLNIVTPLWLNQAGTGLLLDEDPGELALTLSQNGSDELQILRRAPELAPAVREQAVERVPARLTLRLLVGDHIRAARSLALNYLGRPTTAPPLELFARPIWTTWARYKMHVTQAQTLQFADEILGHDYPHCVMEIDDRWQAAYGDLRFDPAKFPDPRAMVEQLHDRGFRVTLWVPPFLNPDSQAYRQAAAEHYLLGRDGADEPLLIRWWQGYGGLLDLSNAAACDWWLAGLRRLQEEYGVDGFKFDAGEANFIPRGARSAGDRQPNHYADDYVGFVARNFSWTEVRCGWRSQPHGIFFREYDKWSRWGIDNGLHAVLTQALTLGLIGYPFVLPDMIGGNAVEGEVPNAELMIRWTQLTALLPSMQFSLAPWDYGSETTAICRRYAQLHEKLSPILEQAVAQVLADGTPLVRPIFWEALDDPATYTIDDQFLLGDHLLVAPVLQPGQRERSVYLPAGRWRDYWTGNEYAGPRLLDQHPAPLDTLPLFERVG